jgi:hypothetical protein
MRVIQWHASRVSALLPVDSVHGVRILQVLGSFGAGGWRAAADLYKVWAVKQPWCSVRLRDRVDIPSILLTGVPAVVLSLQNQDGYVLVAR